MARAASVILGLSATMQQASSGDGLSFDPFPLDEDGLAASEVDIGRCQVAQAVVSQMNFTLTQC